MTLIAEDLLLLLVDDTTGKFIVDTTRLDRRSTLPFSGRTARNMIRS